MLGVRRATTRKRRIRHRRWLPLWSTGRPAFPRRSSAPCLSGLALTAHRRRLRRSGGRSVESHRPRRCLHRTRGLSDGAGRAGDDYQTKTGQAQGLDDRLTQEINDAVSSNQQARDRITGILNEMKTYQAGVVASNDPLALSNYQKYLDQKLSSVQQIPR